MLYPHTHITPVLKGHFQPSPVSAFANQNSTDASVRKPQFAIGRLAIGAFCPHNIATLSRASATRHKAIVQCYDEKIVLQSCFL